MPRWDFDTSAAHLRKALEELQIAWQETSESWQDDVSQKFCATQLEPIGPVLKTTLEEVARMQQLVSQMARECEA